MARCPFAEWKPLPWSVGPYVEGPFKLVHHTTQGSTAQGAFAQYQKTHFIPHFTVDETTIYQHVDTDLAVTALAHPRGTVETNKSHAIQFELVAFAEIPKNRRALTNVGRLCRWAEQQHGIPKVWPNGPPNPPDNGHDPGHHNRDSTTWRTTGGHYGHCHVPGNEHWDPAYTEEEVAFLMAVPADGPVAASVHSPLSAPRFERPYASTVNARPGLRLRSGPGAEFDVISVLPLGTRVYPLKAVGAWTLVDLTGDSTADGFLLSEFLVTKGARSQQPG